MESHEQFANQKAAPEDTERVFAVLRPICDIVRVPARFTSMRELSLVMKTPIVLHNRAVEELYHKEFPDREAVTERLGAVDSPVDVGEACVKKCCGDSVSSNTTRWKVCAEGC